MQNYLPAQEWLSRLVNQDEDTKRIFSLRYYLLRYDLFPSLGKINQFSYDNIERNNTDVCIAYLQSEIVSRQIEAGYFTEIPYRFLLLFRNVPILSVLNRTQNMSTRINYLAEKEYKLASLYLQRMKVSEEGREKELEGNKGFYGSDNTPHLLSFYYFHVTPVIDLDAIHSKYFLHY